MSAAPRNRPLWYAAATAGVVVATLVRWLLDPVVGDNFPLVTFFVATLAAAWYGGFGPALLTVGLGAVVATLCFVPPRGSLSVDDPRTLFVLALYVGVGILFAGFGEAILIARRRAAASAAEASRRSTALAASERRFRTLATFAPVGIFETDADGYCLFVNDRWCRITGLSPDEAAGDGWARALHPDDRERVRGEWYAAATAAREFAAEYRFLTPDGRAVWVRGNAVALRDEAGNVTGHLGTVVDVTAERSATEGLRENELRLRTLSDNLPDGAVYQTTGDPGGGRRFVYISAGVERLFGVTPAEVMADAAALYGLVHADDLPRLAAAEEAAVREMGPFDCEFRSHTRGGGVRWVHCRSAPRRLPTGEIVWEGIITDATARRRAEDALRDADRRKDEFLATLAHELRNPLAPLRTGLQVVRLNRGDAAAADRVLGMMERQLGHMVHLIDDLLDVGRITRGRLRLRRERVGLAAVVGTAVEASRPAVEAAGHRLAVSLPPEPVWLDADPTRLTQVLANLLTNAAKYTDPGGDITLTARRDGATVEVSVRDTGIGVAAEHLPGLFEMFSQVVPAQERAQGGLGIGLALVKGLVEMHDGTVEAHSAGPGQGSEFVVRLPVADGPAPSPAPPEVSPPVRARRRILVADDNRDAADSLAMLLQLAGHEVRTAHDGLAAVAVAAESRPDVAVLDIGMPGLTGYEAARRIRAEPWGRGMVLVALTGWGQDGDKQQAAEAGFDHHLTKPVDPAALNNLLSGAPTAANSGDVLPGGRV